VGSLGSLFRNELGKGSILRAECVIAQEDEVDPIDEGVRDEGAE